MRKVFNNISMATLDRSDAQHLYGNTGQAVTDEEVRSWRDVEALSATGREVVELKASGSRILFWMGLS